MKYLVAPFMSIFDHFLNSRCQSEQKLILDLCQFTYAGKSGFMVHMDPGGNVPSVVRFAVNLVRWPEWASALRIFSG